MRPRKEIENISKQLVGTSADSPGHLQLILEVMLDIRDLVRKT